MTGYLCVLKQSLTWASRGRGSSRGSAINLEPCESQCQPLSLAPGTWRLKQGSGRSLLPDLPDSPLTCYLESWSLLFSQI